MVALPAGVLWNVASSHHALLVLSHYFGGRAGNCTLAESFEAEALVVVDSAERRQVIGLLSEAHALRRYSDASERQRRELLGDI